MGKVIFQLLGDNYKVLYQEKEFSEGMFTEHNTSCILFQEDSKMYPILKEKVCENSRNIQIALVLDTNGS